MIFIVVFGFALVLGWSMFTGFPCSKVYNAIAQIAQRRVQVWDVILGSTFGESREQDAEKIADRSVGKVQVGTGPGSFAAHRHYRMRVLCVHLHLSFT